MFKVIEQNIIQHIPYNALTAPSPWEGEGAEVFEHTDEQ